VLHYFSLMKSVSEEPASVELNQEGTIAYLGIEREGVQVINATRESGFTEITRDRCNSHFCSEISRVNNVLVGDVAPGMRLYRERSILMVGESDTDGVRTYNVSNSNFNYIQTVSGGLGKKQQITVNLIFTGNPRDITFMRTKPIMWVTFASNGLCAYNMSNILNIVPIPNLCYADEGGNLSNVYNI
jgi:hypothetical protein